VIIVARDAPGLQETRVEGIENWYRDVSALIDKVRRVEATDPCGERWPRYKASDDASAVNVWFNNS
jgi:hypothetical protein